MSDENPPKTNARYYAAAADYLRQHGWTQRQQHNPMGAVCGFMALAAVTNQSEPRKISHVFVQEVDAFLQVYDLSYIRLRRQVLTDTDSPIWALVRWNDCDHRSADHVIEMFDALAMAVEAGWTPQDTETALAEITALDTIMAMYEPELVGA